MSMNLGLGIGLGFQRGAGAAASSPLDVITSSNGAWWVVAERDGSNHLVDQTGGGRNLLLPGGSANPVLLDHTGTDYFWFPGTASNTLTTGGLSNSTAYDYKVFYLDGSSATGEETTSAGGVLTLGGTQTNFNVKKVTRIRVVADGADPDVATAVRDILAADADPDATTFVEASSNAATVTINRSSTGYKTAVVDQPQYAFATDDYLYAADASVFDSTASDDLTVLWVGRTHGGYGLFLALISKKDGTAAGWVIDGGSPVSPVQVRVAVDDGPDIAQVESLPAAIDHSLNAIALVLDRTAQTINLVVNGAAGASPASTAAVGDASNAIPLTVGAIDSPAASFLDFFFVGAAVTQQTLTAAEISDIADALITANGGTP